MRIRIRPTLVALALLIPPMAAAPPARADDDAAAGHAELVRLFEEWRRFQRPEIRDGVPDYTVSAMAAQHRRLPSFRDRLAAIDPSGWPVAQQIDHHLVKAEMNGLDFDHRVMRPWARDPAFYQPMIAYESDTPLREGPVMEGAIELWRMSFPLPAEEVGQFQAQLRVIPAILEQARGNLVGNARDFWRLGLLTQRRQSELLADFAERLAGDHPELVPDLEAARRAVDSFVTWLEESLPGKTGPSGVGVENYDWYLRHVHLVPYGWQDELRLMRRELARTVAHLALEEHRNRELPPLEPAASVEAWQKAADASIDAFLRFLDEREVLAVEDWMEPALRERVASWSPPERRHFFAQVDLRDPRVMRCHHIHWIDKARMRQEPHPSPIRRVPSLYNIWDSRSEGLATAMEEMMASAGLVDDSPRSRELVYIMVAQRAARAIAGLRVQSNEWSVEEAVRYAAEKTPRGWFRADGDLVLFEQQLYLRQPGYGTSYLTGKALIESLLAERALELGEAFTLEGFMEELFASGLIPVSLIRWEMTGRDDEVRRLVE